MQCIVKKLLLNVEISHNFTNAKFGHLAGKQEKQNMG